MRALEIVWSSFPHPDWLLWHLNPNAPWRHVDFPEVTVGVLPVVGIPVHQVIIFEFDKLRHLFEVACLTLTLEESAEQVSESYFRRGCRYQNRNSTPDDPLQSLVQWFITTPKQSICYLMSSEVIVEETFLTSRVGRRRLTVVSGPHYIKHLKLSRDELALAIHFRSKRLIKSPTNNKSSYTTVGFVFPVRIGKNPVWRQSWEWPSHLLEWVGSVAVRMLLFILCVDYL